MIIFYFLILGGIKIILEESDSFCSYSPRKELKTQADPVLLFKIYIKDTFHLASIHIFLRKINVPNTFRSFSSSNSPLLTYLLRIHTRTHTKRTFHVLPRFTFRSLIDRGHAITNQEPRTGSSPVEINLSFPLDYPADSTTSARTDEPKEK